MNHQILEELKLICGDSVYFNHTLKNLSYLKTGGVAAAFVKCESVDLLSEVVQFLTAKKIAYEVLGRGTNTLIKEGLIDKVILQLNFPSRIISCADSVIELPASLPLIKANKLAHENGLSGLEFFVGIPGSVGGAVVMNAGVKGEEVSHVLTKITLLRNGALIELAKNELDLTYRHSNLGVNDIVVSASFKLRALPEEGIKQKKQKCLTELGKRKASQPYKDLSVGSTFANPLPQFAGALIEQAGLKGKKIGGISVSEKHANFIINDGTGTTDEAVQLIDFIKQEVKKKSGIELREEVRRFGFP